MKRSVNGVTSLLPPLPKICDLPRVVHRQSRHLNHRAEENSHQPTRQRERRMRRFKSPEQAQAFFLCSILSSRTSAPTAIESLWHNTGCSAKLIPDVGRNHWAVPLSATL